MGGIYVHVPIVFLGFMDRAVANHTQRRIRSVSECFFSESESSAYQYGAVVVVYKLGTRGGHRCGDGVVWLHSCSQRASMIDVLFHR